MGKPPFALIASRSGIAQRCSRRITAAAVSSGCPRRSSPRPREDAFGGRLGAELRAHLSTLLAACPQADERPDHGELGGLLAAQVASLEDVHLALRVLVNRESVDHADDVVLLQAVELGHDLTLEVRVIEAEHE